MAAAVAAAEPGDVHLRDNPWLPCQDVALAQLDRSLRKARRLQKVLRKAADLVTEFGRSLEQLAAAAVEEEAAAAVEEGGAACNAGDPKDELDRISLSSLKTMEVYGAAHRRFGANLHASWQLLKDADSRSRRLRGRTAQELAKLRSQQAHMQDKVRKQRAQAAREWDSLDSAVAALVRMRRSLGPAPQKRRLEAAQNKVSGKHSQLMQLVLKHDDTLRQANSLSSFCLTRAYPDLMDQLEEIETNRCRLVARSLAYVAHGFRRASERTLPAVTTLHREVQEIDRHAVLQSWIRQAQASVEPKPTVEELWLRYELPVDAASLNGEAWQPLLAAEDEEAHRQQMLQRQLRREHQQLPQQRSRRSPSRIPGSTPHKVMCFRALDTIELDEQQAGLTDRWGKPVLPIAAGDMVVLVAKTREPDVPVTPTPPKPVSPPISPHKGSSQPRSPAVRDAPASPPNLGKAAEPASRTGFLSGPSRRTASDSSNGVDLADDGSNDLDEGAPPDETSAGEDDISANEFELTAVGGLGLDELDEHCEVNGPPPSDSSLDSEDEESGGDELCGLTDAEEDVGEEEQEQGDASDAMISLKTILEEFDGISEDEEKQPSFPTASAAGLAPRMIDVWYVKVVDTNGFPEHIEGAGRRLTSLEDLQQLQIGPAMNLRQFLQYEHGLQPFTAHLVIERNHENLLFWVEMREFWEQLPDIISTYALYQKAASIARKYIGNEAFMQVNISSARVAQIQAQLREAEAVLAGQPSAYLGKVTLPPPLPNSPFSWSPDTPMVFLQQEFRLAEVFNLALDEVFKLLEADSFKRFKYSNAFRDWFDESQKPLH